MLEVVHNVDPSSDELSQTPDSLECTQSTWHKFVHSSPLLYAKSLAVMTWKDGEEQVVDQLGDQLQHYEECLSSSLWACISALEKLSVEFQLFKDSMPYSPPAQTSVPVIRSVSLLRRRDIMGQTMCHSVVLPI